MELNEAIANNIKNFRKRLNISQAELAELSDLSPAMIARIEICKSTPSIASLTKIAKSLKVQPYEILLLPEDKTPFNREQLADNIYEDMYSLTKKFENNLNELIFKYKR